MQNWDLYICRYVYLHIILRSIRQTDKSLCIFFFRRWTHKGAYLFFSSASSALCNSMVRGLLGTSFFYFALLALAPQVVWHLYCRLSLLYPLIDGCVRSTSTNLSLSVWPLNEKFCRWVFLRWVCGRPRQLDNRGEERQRAVHGPAAPVTTGQGFCLWMLLQLSRSASCSLSWPLTFYHTTSSACLTPVRFLRWLFNTCTFLCKTTVTIKLSN